MRQEGARDAGPSTAATGPSAYHDADPPAATAIAATDASTSRADRG